MKRVRIELCKSETLHYVAEQCALIRKSCRRPNHGLQDFLLTISSQSRSFTTITSVLMTRGWPPISDCLGTIPLKPLLLHQITYTYIFTPASCSQISWRLKFFKRTMIKQSCFSSSTLFKHVPQPVSSWTVYFSCTSTCAPSPSVLQAPGVCWRCRQVVPSRLQSYPCTWSTRCMFAGYVSVFLPKGMLRCHKSVIWLLEILLKTAY